MRFSSKAGDFATIIIQDHDASVIDARKAPDGSHAAVDHAYAAKDAMNAVLNPPRPDLPPTSAH